MLEHKVFLQGINFLRANYLNWNFDINDDLQLKVWYKKFCNLETKEFMQLIEKFTEENKFPPNSPTDILGLVRSGFEKGEDAWKWVKSLMEQYPLGNDYYEPKFFQELSKDLIAYKLFNLLKIKDVFLEQEEESPFKVKGTLTLVASWKNYVEDKFIKYYDQEILPRRLLKLEAKEEEKFLLEKGV